MMFVAYLEYRFVCFLVMVMFVVCCNLALLVVLMFGKLEKILYQKREQCTI